MCVARVRSYLADDLDTPKALAALDGWTTDALEYGGHDSEAPQTVAAAVDALLGRQAVERPPARRVVGGVRLTAMGSVNGKVALITGGANGVGAEVARRLHAKGAKLVLTDLDEVPAQGCRHPAR